MPRVFISHATPDQGFVESEVLPALKACKLDVWYSKHAIKSAAEWERDILTGLKGCDWFLAVLSSHSASSRWVKAEIDWAMDQRWGRILPVVIDACDPTDLHLMLRQIQNCSFYPTLDSGRQQLREWAETVRRGGRSAQTLVLAIMGAKGGVGKSTLIAGMAQLIASAGHHVAIVDTDLEAAGITAYLGGWAARKPPVWSLLDAAYQRQSGGPTPANADLSVWDVAPESLRSEPRFGRLYLVPARLPSDARQGYRAVADIEDRPAATLAILQETLDRLQQLDPPPECVLVDCGAENNPMVSAAFVLAKYGFLVSHPNVEFAKAIPRLTLMHRENFPHAEHRPMHVVVNMAKPDTKEHWASTGASLFVPEDATMRSVSADGRPIDFMARFKGTGLNRFFLGVLHVLNATFDTDDQRLLPDEVDVWIRPYLEAMETFPETLLRRPRYRLVSLMTFGIVMAGVLVSVVSAGLFWQLGRQSRDVVVEQPIVDVDGQAPPDLAATWGRVQLPTALSDKIAVDRGILRLRGGLMDAELDELKKLIGSQPVMLAVAEAARKSHLQQQAESNRIEQIRRVLLIIAGLGGVIVACGVYFGRFNAQRKKMLEGLAAARNDRRRMTEFIRQLVSDDEGKPQLKWLQDEFRSHHASPLD